MIIYKDQTHKLQPEEEKRISKGTLHEENWKGNQMAWACTLIEEWHVEDLRICTYQPM